MVVVENKTSIKSAFIDHLSEVGGGGGWEY